MLLFKSSASEGTCLIVQICYDPPEKHWHFWANAHSHAFYGLSQSSIFSSTSNGTERLDYQNVWKGINFTIYASSANDGHVHVQRTIMSLYQMCWGPRVSCNFAPEYLVSSNSLLMGSRLQKQKTDYQTEYSLVYLIHSPLYVLYVMISCIADDLSL